LITLGGNDNDIALFAAPKVEDVAPPSPILSSPTPTPTPSATPTTTRGPLVFTGAQVGGISAVAGGLLALGGILVLMAALKKKRREEEENGTTAI
jgi:hypothetical protein